MSAFLPTPDEEARAARAECEADARADEEATARTAPDFACRQCEREVDPADLFNDGRCRWCHEAEDAERDADQRAEAAARTAPTPGPWHGCAVQPDAIIADSPLGIWRLEACDPHRLDEERDHFGGYLVAESVAPPNRPLIIAAPDMLEACREALPWLEQRGNTGIVARVRAAIAKAEGRDV